MMLKKWIKTNPILSIAIVVSIIVVTLAIALPTSLIPLYSSNKNSVNTNKDDYENGYKDNNDKTNNEINKYKKPISLDDFVKSGNNFNHLTFDRSAIKRKINIDSVHDGDTFRGRYDNNEEIINGIRIIGIDTPEVMGDNVEGQTIGERTNELKKILKNTKNDDKYIKFFGFKATYKARDILQNKKYRIYSFLINTTTHDRPLMSLFIDLVDTTPIELYSFASILVRMGLAIPATPNKGLSATHFHIHKHDVRDPKDYVSAFEKAFEDDLEKNFLLAYKEKNGFFNPKEWLSPTNPNEVWNEPNNWHTKNTWSEMIIKNVYHTNWWKNDKRENKYCTIDTLLDNKICDLIKVD